MTIRVTTNRLARWVLGCALCLIGSVAAATEPTLTMKQAADRIGDRGFVLMMRHAQTVPGIGDPPGFKLDQCETQRNLSEQGRTQARRIGQALKHSGIKIGMVRNSQWCRCRETAQLAFGAKNTQDWPVLNSFFADRSSEPAQTAKLRQHAVTLVNQMNVMLVTHQVNINAALGTFARQGEIIAAKVQDGRLTIAFRIAP